MAAPLPDAAPRDQRRARPDIVPARPHDRATLPHEGHDASTGRGTPVPWSRIAGIVALWAMLVGLVLLELYPALPTGARGWILLVLAGPAAYLALELAGERLLSRRAGLRISPARFSWKRIAAVLLALIALALLLAAALRF
jgi:hypothetical protein